MSRTQRTHAPGAVFHVYSRTNGYAQWFTYPVKDGILRTIKEALLRSDAELIAYAVMNNHFHMVIRQGKAPLSQLMQPLCRKIALMVQNHHDLTGYIFERRFQDRICRDPFYMRNAIAYTHNNPVVGRLCDRASEYPWSSARFYDAESGADAWEHLRPPITCAVQLFSSEPESSVNEWRSNHNAFCAARRSTECTLEDPEPLLLPNTMAGNDYWLANFGSVENQVAINQPAKRPDLRDIVRVVLQQFEPTITIDQLRMYRGSHKVSEIRNRAIAEATLSGYRPYQIANLLNVSSTTVSKVAVTIPDRPHVRFD